MKRQFNKIFPLLIKQEENTGKPHFGPNLGLLGPNLGHKFFLDVKDCPKLQSCATSRKNNDADLRKWRKT